MNVVATMFSRCRLIAVGAFFLVAPMANVSQAETVAADTFTRADTGIGEDDLGTTEVGDFAWKEYFIQNPFHDPDVGEILDGELKLNASHCFAFIDVGLSDLTASVDMHFGGVSESDSQTSFMSGFLMRFSDPEVVPFFNPEENRGTVMAFVTPTGSMLIGENRSGNFDWDYIDNPFNEGEVAFNTFGDPGSLPTTINGAPFDANGNGRLDDDEPFHFAAVLAGQNLDLQINGETIKSATLAYTGGFSANGFALVRHHIGGSFQHFPYFDNLVIDGVPPQDGDFDLDGDVDGADFLVWQRDPGVGLLSDWQTNYGNGSSLTAAVAAVPEPSTLGLFALALGAISLRRSRS